MNGPAKSTRCAPPSAHHCRRIRSMPFPCICGASTAGRVPQRALRPWTDKGVDASRAKAVQASRATVGFLGRRPSCVPVVEVLIADLKKHLLADESYAELKQCGAEVLDPLSGTPFTRSG